MRRKRLLFNTIASLTNQVVVAVCGLILPRAILSYYGSEVNGLLSSITQFLGLIAFMELGVGAVVQSSMYKPLAANDYLELSKIMISARNFFRRIAVIFLGYVVVLTAIFPFIINNHFGYFYTASLVIIISISSFAEYYFGIVNQLLLNADQKAYIHLVLRSITQVLNVVFCMILIYCGCSIQLVKLTTSIFFMARPLIQWLYVKRNYQINYGIELDEEPIKQKWNGLAQHLAAVVLDKTDVVVLTTFSTLQNVSVYSVYYLVVNNLRQLVVSGTVGVQALLGNMLAKGEYDELNEFFDSVEIVTHFIITFLFTTCGCLLVPFVAVYTSGIDDTNYIVPVFSALITLANAFYSFRNSYNMVIKAAGHYKETQNSAIIEVIINVVVSLILVIKLGLVGVAIGTLVSMLYRTIYFVFYLKNNILYRSTKEFFGNLLVDAIISIVSVLCCSYASYSVTTYMEWFLLAIREALICGAIGFTVNIAVYRQKFVKSLGMLRKGK